MITAAVSCFRKLEYHLGASRVLTVQIWQLRPDSRERFRARQKRSVLRSHMEARHRGVSDQARAWIARGT